MLTVKEILDNATSSLRPVSLTGHPHTLQEALNLYTQYCCGVTASPPPLPVEPHIWFDFTDLATINSGSTVVGDALSSIEDKIAGYVASKDVTAAKPQVTADGVLFDGADDYLDVDIVVGNPWTIVIAVDTFNNNVILANAVGDYIFHFFGASLYSSNTGNIIQQSKNSDTAIIPSLRADTIQTTQRVDGLDVTNSSFNNSTLRIKNIARQLNATYYANAIMKHIVIFDKFLSDSELANVEAFLNA